MKTNPLGGINMFETIKASGTEWNGYLALRLLVVPESVRKHGLRGAPQSSAGRCGVKFLVNISFARTCG
jgi:hypothetical protein